MVRVFCDFDGTIATEDIGRTIFQKFAGNGVKAIVHEYLKGEINAQEFFKRECSAVQNAPLETLYELVDSCSVDPGFHSFERFCQAHGIAVTILSDGFDLYVHRFLGNHGLGHLPAFTNRLRIIEEDSRTEWIPSFPYTDAECPQCAHCKRNHLLTLSGIDDVIVYVGDGYSDRCPIRYADIVFAKRDLVRHCQEQNITYYPFDTFFDVEERIRTIQKGRLKKRTAAEHARRELYAQG